MSSPLILVVDDETDIRDLVCDILQDEGYRVESAEDGKSAQLALKNCLPDLILLDIWMPDVDGITLLKEWSETQSLPCPVIMMSGHGTVETAVEATRLGAYDFIEKPLTIAKTLLTIERALEASRLHQEVAILREKSTPITEPIGKSAVMNHTWVLISGEAGTGKMSFARYLHAQSPRSDGPFIEATAGMIASENSSRDLFGLESEDRVQYGLLERANRGTLFIDEVSDLDLQTQARLLGALQSGKVVRIGGNEPIPLNVRVVAASRIDLEEAVREGTFREDLFYQLNVLPLRIPPLREHPEDIPDLLNYYVDYFVRHDNLKYRRFGFAAQNRLRQHDWPGNIRELKNLVQRLLILGNQEEISADEIGACLGSPSYRVDPTREEDMALTSLLESPYRDAREQFDKAYFMHQLEKTGGNVGELARNVGVERTNLYRKLKALGIDPRDASR
jgi:DNA-binding NtrC family response regulator